MKSRSQQVFSGLCWGFGGTLCFALRKSPEQRLGACSLGAKRAQCKVGSQGFVTAQCWGYHMTLPFFWAQFELVLCKLQEFCSPAQVLQSRGRRKKKMVRDFFSFPPRSSMTVKALIFAHLAASLSVLFLELYLQLNAVSSSGLFRPFRTSGGHLCWVDRSPSSIFLFSAYQTHVHFNIRSLILSSSSPPSWCWTWIIEFILYLLRLEGFSEQSNAHIWFCFLDFSKDHR